MVAAQRAAHRCGLVEWENEITAIFIRFNTKGMTTIIFLRNNFLNK